MFSFPILEKLFSLYYVAPLFNELRCCCSVGCPLLFAALFFFSLLAKVKRRTTTTNDKISTFFVECVSTATDQPKWAGNLLKYAAAAATRRLFFLLTSSESFIFPASSFFKYSKHLQLVSALYSVLYHHCTLDTKYLRN